MAIMHQRLRIVSTDSDGDDRHDRASAVAPPDWSLGLDPMPPAGANTLLHSLLAIQRECTLSGRLDRLVEATAGLLQRTDVAVAMLDDVYTLAEERGLKLGIVEMHSEPLDTLVRAGIAGRVMVKLTTTPATGLPASNTWAPRPTASPRRYTALDVARVSVSGPVLGPRRGQALIALADQPVPRSTARPSYLVSDGPTAATSTARWRHGRDCCRPRDTAAPMATVADLSQFALTDDLDDVLNAAAMVIRVC
jgi:hypothetical protein